jgi:hypothetical protein
MNQAIQITEFDADYTRWIGSASRCRANLQAKPPALAACFDPPSRL